MTDYREGNDFETLMDKAVRQETAKANLLLAVAEIVSELISDKGDEWDSVPYDKARRINDLIWEFKEASK